MPVIEYKVKHYYQPTNHSCAQTALAILFSYYDKTLTPEDIINNIPVNKNDKGEDWGSINQNLATWCISQGFDTEMHSADFQIIDLGWRDLPKDKLLERMEATKTNRNVPGLGKQWSKTYMQSYIDFISAGGQLHIHPFMTTQLIDIELSKGPLLVAICFAVMYGNGRGKEVGLRKMEPDDAYGKLTNHSIVVYGRDTDGSYLVADPWQEPGQHHIEPERLLCSMTAAQIECDNLFFRITPKS